MTQDCGDSWNPGTLPFALLSARTSAGERMSGATPEGGPAGAPVRSPSQVPRRSPVCSSPGSPCSLLHQRPFQQERRHSGGLSSSTPPARRTSLAQLQESGPRASSGLLRRHLEPPDSSFTGAEGHGGSRGPGPSFRKGGPVLLIKRSWTPSFFSSLHPILEMNVLNEIP